MQFKDFINEARRNPDQNPKIPVVDQLKKIFKDNYEYDDPRDVVKEGHDDLYFVSMTKVDKLGINPSSKYNTPLGIYAYPLSYVLHKVELENESEGRQTLKSLPFAGASPFANVFKTDPNRTLICLNKENFDSVTFNYYVRKIGNYLARFRIERMEKRFGDKMDDEKREIYWKNSVDSVEEWASKSEGSARVQTWGGRFWYVTMKAADMMAMSSGKEQKEGKVAPDSLLWNKLFREIGIDGVVDYGEGIIHGAEPTQAVFFSKEPIEVVARFDNKDYAPSDATAAKVLSKANEDVFVGLFYNDPKKAASGAKLFKSFFKKDLGEQFKSSGFSIMRKYGFIYNVIGNILDKVYEEAVPSPKQSKKAVDLIQKAMGLANINQLDQDYIKQTVYISALIKAFPLLQFASDENLQKLVSEYISEFFEEVGASPENEEAVKALPRVWQAFVDAVEYKKGKGNFEATFDKYRHWKHD
jgi:hypothetical protein